jgi:hypothetical protein
MAVVIGPGRRFVPLKGKGTPPAQQDLRLGPFGARRRLAPADLICYQQGLVAFVADGQSGPLAPPLSVNLIDHGLPPALDAEFSLNAITESLKQI